MSMLVCKLMNIPYDVSEKVHIAAHLHDIGKIGIPDAILNKDAKLEDWEWNIIKKHPQIGADILNKFAHLAEMKDIVLHHHERYDGLGYPDALYGDRIPLGARIIALCDSIDAMTSTRSYRKAYTYEYCFCDIEKNLAKMYDPNIGKIVLEQSIDLG